MCDIWAVRYDVVFNEILKEQFTLIKYEHNVYADKSNSKSDNHTHKLDMI